jgi:hypothetical protein
MVPGPFHSNIHVFVCNNRHGFAQFYCHSDPMQKVTLTKFDKIYLGVNFGEVSLVIY